MYQFDFVSVAFGYICGIVLYANMSNIMYMENDDESARLHTVGGMFCDWLWHDVSPSSVSTYVKQGGPGAS